MGSCEDYIEQVESQEPDLLMSTEQWIIEREAEEEKAFDQWMSERDTLYAESALADQRLARGKPGLSFPRSAKLEAHTTSPVLAIDVFSKLCMVYVSDDGKEKGGSWTFEGVGFYVAKGGSTWFVTANHVMTKKFFVVAPTNGAHTRWGPVQLKDVVSTVFEKDVLVIANPKTIVCSAFAFAEPSPLQTVATITVKTKGQGAYTYDSFSIGQIVRETLPTQLPSVYGGLHPVNVMTHNCSTSPGSSGSPMILMAVGTTKPTVVGVHVAGDSGKKENYMIPIQNMWFSAKAPSSDKPAVSLEAVAPVSPVSDTKALYDSRAVSCVGCAAIMYLPRGRQATKCNVCDEKSLAGKALPTGKTVCQTCLLAGHTLEVAFPHGTRRCTIVRGKAVCKGDLCHGHFLHPSGNSVAPPSSRPGGQPPAGAAGQSVGVPARM
jgi:hypothetical protein